MPIYEFQCRSCEAEFEELVQRTEDAASVSCPACGKKNPARKFSVFAARGDAATSKSKNDAGGGCGRCGDPAGPCAM